MGRRIALTLVFAFVASCAPTALPRSSGDVPTAPPGRPVTSDVITLREGGQQSYLAVRKVGTGDLVRQLVDGALLPDGTTILTATVNGNATTVATVDRRSGATIASRTIPDVWRLTLGASGYAAASTNGRYAVLAGSAFNFTDATGAWTAKTTFALIDTSLASDPRIIDLPGRFTFQDVSSDGRSLYVIDNSPPQLPTSWRLRVDDVASGSLADVGEGSPDASAYRTSPVRIGDTSFSLFASASKIGLTRLDLAERRAATLTLPDDQRVMGEEMLMWSLLPSRDGRTLYLVNPAVGVIDEVDPASLTLRRTGRIGRPAGTSLLVRIVDAVHPVADAKMGVNTGAVLSRDGAHIYAIGDPGVWEIDTATLSAHQLVRDGMYTTIALSPDGERLYALRFSDLLVRVLSARDGSALGDMPRIAAPSDIVAVDAGE